MPESNSSPPVAKGWLSRSVASPGITSARGNFCFETTTVTLSNPALKFFSSLRGLPTQFKRYLGAVGLFGIGASRC